MIGIVTGWIKSALTYVGAFFSGFFVGQLREEKKQKDREIENLENTIRNMSDRPRTNADRHNRVRAWADKLPKSDR